ncbi:DUF6233 domain-containing protein [Streptomyces sp. NPDC006339]|uniref:DUF6233 domain-containing protein n=1 Tax=Streptomyces sp. NPDC006339 TaxID=3156755 RepID=UPI0033B0D0E1
MNGLTISERLAKQRTLREWLAYQLAQADRAISELEAQEAEERRRRGVARREMSWKLQPARAVEGHPVLHRGNCSIFNGEIGYLNLEEVKIAFQEFPDLVQCTICNPWGSLGIDKPAPRKLPGGGTP